MNPTFRTTGQHDAALTTNVSRMVWIGLLVVTAHAGLIWAIQSKVSLNLPKEVVIPITLQSVFITRPAPVITTPKSKPAEKASFVKPAQKSTPEPTPVTAPKPTPVPKPIAKLTPTPTPTPTLAPTLTPTANPITPAPKPTVTAATPAQNTQATSNTSPTAASANPNVSPVPLTVQLPSSNADYLKNPAPVYPALSLRMNEQGQSLVKVLIGSDGQAQRAELAKSSGYDRLDRAAVAAVLQWRFVPGQRGGVAESMWYQVPINWKLRD
jgi:protein TonB